MWPGVFLVAGVGGWWLTRRRAAAISPGLLVCGVSLSLALGANQIAGHFLDPFVFAAHAGAGLCLLWAIVVAASGRPEHGADADSQDTFVSVAQIGALAAGLLCLVILLYAAVFETLNRTINWAPRPGQPPMSYVGLADLAVIALALILVLYRRRNPSLVTALFWTLCFGCLWGSLTVRPAAALPVAGAGAVGVMDSGWSRVLLVGVAGVVAAFAWGQGWRYASRRRGALPDKLHVLLSDYPHWPGFRYSVGVVSIVLIGLACLNADWWPTVVSCGVAAAAVFYLVHRQWNENLADAAAGLATLAVTAMFICLASEPQRELADRFPVYFNMAVVGMALMTALWHWLARFWKQQLLDGEPWTTTGRMIVIARRFGFIVAGLTIVVALQLAVWPLLPMVHVTDDSAGRLVMGGGAFVLLVVVLAWCALVTDRAGLAVMTIAAAGVAGVYLWIRMPPSSLKSWIAEHWPVLLAAASIPAAAAVVGPLKRRAAVFVDPLTGLGTVVLPALALAGIITFSARRAMVFVTLCCLALAFSVWVLGARVRQKQ